MNQVEGCPPVGNIVIFGDVIDQGLNALADVALHQLESVVVGGARRLDVDHGKAFVVHALANQLGQFPGLAGKA